MGRKTKPKLALAFKGTRLLPGASPNFPTVMNTLALAIFFLIALFGSLVAAEEQKKARFRNTAYHTVYYTPAVTVFATETATTRPLRQG